MNKSPAARGQRLTSAYVIAALMGATFTASVAPDAARASAPESAVTVERSAAHSGKRACVLPEGEPCPTNPKQAVKMFKAGKLGHSTATRQSFSPKFKRMMKRSAIRKGIVRDPATRSIQDDARLAKQDWGDYFRGFVNVLDCVAPGAEASCREDFEEIKPLKEPTKVVVLCGGAAVVAFYTAGTSTVATAVGGGALGCFWGAALD